MIYFRSSALIILILLLSNTQSYWWWGNIEEPWDTKDNVGLENRYKMRNISHELLMTATLKVRHILDIRDYHSDSISYQVGYIMGKVREKYRRMMEHYYQWRDKASGKSGFVGPGIREIRPIHFLLTMEHIFTYEASIHKYCDAIISFFTNDTYPVKGAEKINRAILKRQQKKKTANKSPKKLPPNGTLPSSLRRMEAMLKSSYRQQFLMRRLGLPINQTTRSKRFLHNWPVEGSWDFGPYDVGI
ncbi:uncharacterized protein LOC128682020 [Plodia interpunctella]|uniref:uncharacterized protein LOC128682020 n=1 Tax=Plodia interpunctella TaxID=58824 RepID=UPI0023675556|nr:uncharacterized protein LOC128682020 [Plodia interpunctella]